jgi:hypothetical protein
MADGNRTNPAIVILAVIGALALILLVIGFLTHGSMMGGMRGGGMMGGAGWLVGFLILGALVVLVVVLARRRP